MATEIVKVQQALFPAGSPALVYAKGRDRLGTTTLSAVTRNAMGASAKAYFHATWAGETWSIGERAPDQSW